MDQLLIRLTGKYYTYDFHLGLYRKKTLKRSID